MKTKSIYQGIALLTLALTTAACQNELNDTATQPQPGEKVNMTIRATQGTTPQTRTEYDDQLGEGIAGSVVVKWEGGMGVTALEKIKVFGYDSDEDGFTASAEFTSKPDSRSTDGLSIDFGGTPPTGTKLLAVHPASNCKLDKGYIYSSFLDQTQNCASGQAMAHLKQYDIMIGSPATDNSNNFEFKHTAIMLRFDLTLPTAESVTTVILATSIEDGIATEAYINAGMAYKLLPSTFAQEISLGITNHTKATTLKAYMMVPYLDVDNATLTITVATNNGNSYEGILKTDPDTSPLIAGKCYTLASTLTPLSKINIPSAAEGDLANALKDFTPKSTQTELAVTGTVGNDDIAALATFLKADKAEKITTLDLSGITSVTEVKGFGACAQVTTVILPDLATVIGDDAFAGCTALTTVTQNEATQIAQTRASMPKKVKTVGANAFKNCTSMTEMFLHGNISKVGNNAFADCINLKALVFEGTNKVGTGLTLGTGIVANTNADLKIFLPAITDAAVATTYNTALEKPVYYNFSGYGSANAENKVNATNYTLLPHGNGIGEFTPGGEWGE